MSIRIVPALTAEERLAVFRFRYECLVEELGWELPGAAPELGVREPADEGARLFAAFEGDTLVGTNAANCWAEAELPAEVVERLCLRPIEAAFGREAVIVTRKQLVARAHRRTGLALMLYHYAAKATYRPEVQFIIGDCGPELERHYTQLGYRRHGPPFDYGTGAGLSTPLCLVINDLEHLERVGSPLLALASEFGLRDRPDVRAFFHRTYGRFADGT
jgi:hypothetical protein